MNADLDTTPDCPKQNSQADLLVVVVRRRWVRRWRWFGRRRAIDAPDHRRMNRAAIGRRRAYQWHWQARLTWRDVPDDGPVVEYDAVHRLVAVRPDDHVADRRLDGIRGKGAVPERADDADRQRDRNRPLLGRWNRPGIGRRVFVVQWAKRQV